MPPVFDEHSGGQAEGAGGARFGDVALELGLLAPEQLAKLLERQAKYREMGIPMRVDEIAVEMGILARADCNVVLKELRKRRKEAQPKRRPPSEPSGYAADDLEVPCELGPFEVEKRLGGVMGAVYRAKDRRHHRVVALKLLPSAMSADPQVVERFHREARAAGKLKHPNVVEFYEAGVVEGRFFIAMEYVDGEALMDRLESEGRFAERAALELIREMAHALYHIHVNGLLHRDVKPENVIIDRAGRVRLTDLGLAKHLTEDTRLTESGIAIGTPHYISPEQARGEKVIDHRSDLYSIGATLYHLVCGRPPFDGNAAEVMRMHVYDRVPDPQTLAPKLSNETRNLILKLMSKDPARRIQSADALIATINTILEDHGLQVKVESGRLAVPKEAHDPAAKTAPGAQGVPKAAPEQPEETEVEPLPGME